MPYVHKMFPALCLFAGIAAAQYPAPAVAPAPPPPPPARAYAPAPAPMPAPMPVPAAAWSADQFPAVAPMPPLPPADFNYKFEMDQERVFEMQERAFKMAERAADMVPPAQLHDVEMQLSKLRASADSFASGFAFAPQQIKFAQNRGEDSLYDSGQRSLEARRWDDALEAFNQVASRAGSRADSAWYWKAYTLRKLGRRDEALAAIAELRKSYPNSRWLDDAKALEVEVKQASGQNVAPESESDEEIKLMALNGLMRSDPDRALPILENLLKSAQSPRLKKNALFVLGQSESPKAAQMLEQVARGQGNPDMQATAIRYLGERRRQTNGPQILSEIYNSSNDVNVKRVALSSLASSRDKDRLLAIAKAEKSPELRLEAIRYLSSLPAAQADLWQLYQAESATDVRQQILQSLPSSNNTDKLVEVARTEKDPKLRRFAIQSLSSTRAASTGDALVSIYTAEQDPAMKRTIIDALYSQRNAKALVQVARNEHDFKMKQQLVERLSGMKAPEATEYLMEILK